jgi:hypothetical protein
LTSKSKDFTNKTKDSSLVWFTKLSFMAIEKRENMIKPTQHMGPSFFNDKDMEIDTLTRDQPNHC